MTFVEICGIIKEKSGRYGVGMKSDRSKIYGYSDEYLLEHGKTSENRINIRADFDVVMTVKEIDNLARCSCRCYIHKIGGLRV